MVNKVKVEITYTPDPIFPAIALATYYTIGKLPWRLDSTGTFDPTSDWTPSYSPDVTLAMNEAYT